MIPEQDTQLTKAQDRHVAATWENHTVPIQMADNVLNLTYVFFILFIVCFISFANFL